MKTDYPKQLVEELRELNKCYLDLINLSFFNNNNDGIEIYRKKQRAAAQSIINFYHLWFIPKYSAIQDDMIKTAGKELCSFSQIASNHLNNGWCLRVNSMLSNSGDKTNAPNNLERLIVKLNKSRKKQKSGIIS